MGRIDKENYYLDIAQTVAERATCHVGQAGQQDQDHIEDEEEKGELVAAIPPVHQFSEKIHEHEL